MVRATADYPLIGLVVCEVGTESSTEPWREVTGDILSFNTNVGVDANPAAKNADVGTASVVFRLTVRRGFDAPPFRPNQKIQLRFRDNHAVRPIFTGVISGAPMKPDPDRGRHSRIVTVSAVDNVAKAANTAVKSQTIDGTNTLKPGFSSWTDKVGQMEQALMAAGDTTPDSDSYISIEPKSIIYSF